MTYSRRILAELTEQPIEAANAISQFSTEQDGAISIFIGQVRDHDPEAGENAVIGIEYSAHPDASSILTEIVDTAIEPCRDGEISSVVLLHRIGMVPVGGIALLALVASSHRQPGLTIVSDLVETTKARLPVWKKQILSDGNAMWSRLP